MVLLNSNLGNIGSQIPDFRLKNLDGSYCSLNDYRENRILVVIFMCNHCPYVIAVIDRLVNLQKKYKNDNVQFIGINSNDVDAYPEDSFENMILFASEKKMNFPYLFDETQETAKNFDAVCTPDIYVYDENRILQYRGRLDDNWKDEKSVTRCDLDEAIMLLLKGEKIGFSQIPSMGCSLKWKK